MESISGANLGAVVPLNKIANLNRRRQRPHSATAPPIKKTDNLVELAYREHNRLYEISTLDKSSDEEEK